jgi:hypothetical protein
MFVLEFEKDPPTFLSAGNEEQSHAVMTYYDLMNPIESVFLKN